MADHRFPGEWTKDGVVLEQLATPDILDKLTDFEMSEGDVLIASYPKTGTTWVEELVWLICNNGDINMALAKDITERVPFLDYGFISSGLNENKPTQCVMKTHLRSQTYARQIEKGNVKVILVIRNPKDTLVSFYHFYRMYEGLGKFSGTFDDFFELYKAKHLIFGDYFEWYSDWLQHRDKPNVKLIKYEDMCRRMRDVIDDVTQFLGRSLSETTIADMMEHLTFDKMSRNEMVNYEKYPYFDTKISRFIRKGQIGDWKNYFSEEQSALIDKVYKSVIEPLGVSLEFE